MGQQKLFKFQKFLIFCYLALFPFGQIPKLILSWINPGLSFHPADVVVILLAITSFRLKYSKSFIALISVLIFTWLISYQLFSEAIFIPGAFYLGRLASYLILFFTIRNLVSKKVISKQLLFSSLIAIGTFIALFGIFQYVFSPDLRNLYYLGWDDHYFRLVSTFLDPAFVGILLVLTILLAFWTKHPVIAAVLLVLLGLTYSRSSYLAFLVAIIYLIRTTRHLKFILLGVIAAVVLILSSQYRGGEGVNLLRINSILSKFNNYNQGMQLYSKFPLLGVGYNNLCIARRVYSPDIDAGDHSCSGLDNSILSLLTTTGILGLMSFTVFSGSLWTDSNKIFKASLIAVFIHGLFTNTYFYPWVLGWLAILYSASASKEKT